MVIYNPSVWINQSDHSAASERDSWFWCPPQQVPPFVGVSVFPLRLSLSWNSSNCHSSHNLTSRVSGLEAFHVSLEFHGFSVVLQMLLSGDFQLNNGTMYMTDFCTAWLNWHTFTLEGFKLHSIQVYHLQLIKMFVLISI